METWQARDLLLSVAFGTSVIGIRVADLLS